MSGGKGIESGGRYQAPQSCRHAGRIREAPSAERSLYTDYGKLKKQVKEYDVIKQNIDSILRLEKEPERGRETERLQ